MKSLVLVMLVALVGCSSSDDDNHHKYSFPFNVFK